MNLIGIIKDVDKLGRVVIPTPLRERYGLAEKIEIIAVEVGLLIRKPNNEEEQKK